MPLTEEIKEKIVAQYKAGVRTLVIARSLGVSRTSVFRQTRNVTRDVMPAPKPYYGGGCPRKIVHRTACVMLHEGYTSYEIGERFGVGSSAVSVHFYRYGTDPAREC